jgi:hypothetical protein
MNYWEIITDKISAKPDGVGAALHLLIARGEHSGSVRNLEHFSSREVFVNMDKKFI